MNKFLLSLLASLLLITGVFAQSTSLPKGPRPEINVEQLPVSAFQKGRFSVKFTKSFERYLTEGAIKSSNGIVSFGNPALDQLNKKFNVHAAVKTFQQVLSDKTFDERHKLWGFHLWYQFSVPDDANIKEIIRAYKDLPGIIEVVEPVYAITRHNNVTAYNRTENAPGKLFYTPNDTRFVEQWHYNNTGQQGGTSGKDIKLVQAWDIVKGNPNVIVGVVDGGIDVLHPDIAPNMWPGNGYNFVDNTTTIDPDEHGTHTSGTIGAVNNNSTGVSGVAGGDGTAGSGIKLMSLEVFGPVNNANDFAAPFIWSADRGAAISQNSWGYTAPNVYDQSILDAIDYFIANGGGTVMKGGLVIFSAGNSNSEAGYYPGFYDRVIAVAATNNKDVRSYYSNFGTWVDISAPGGEQSFANDPKGVLSTTMTSLNGGYEFLQGTSMACPHVSGVAALIISRAPGRLSNDDVKSILLNTTDNHYPDNLSIYSGKLGTGRLNAYQAVLKADAIANSPNVDPVGNYGVALACPNIALSWAKNGANNDVVIAYSPTGNFGLPSGAVAVGDNISGGGTIIYKGNGSSFAYPIQKDSVKHYFKIWSVNASNIYSLGLVKNITSPFSISSISGTAAGANIQVNWTRNCNNNEIIVAANNAAVFGLPTGNLIAGSNISGGGKVIYRGTANNFLYTTPVAGVNFFRIWSANGTEYSSAFLQTAVCFGSIPAPVSEGFESVTFPPVGWQVINPTTDTYTWERTTDASNGGVGSAVMRFYLNNIRGDVDYLLSPSITTGAADSIILTFDRAYKLYDNSSNFTDTLEVVVSTDCGASFVSVWKRGGAQLATVPGAFTGSYVPASTDWQRVRLDVKSVVGNSANFLIAFKTFNRFGQNLYLDNINIATVENGRRDATVRSILNPVIGKLCVRNLTPSVQIGNLGKDTLKTVKVMYSFVQGSTTILDSVIFNGSLPIGSFATVALKAVTLPVGGNYQFNVYTKEPNGLNDQNNQNDTAKLSLTVFDPQPDPVAESFEQSTFPPANWFVFAGPGNLTWQKTTLAASDKTASAVIRNYRINTVGKKDDLYSPLLQIGSPDSVYLNFTVAHSTRVFPGTTGFPLDTMEIFLTSDCGLTLRSVYKKWGEDLSTTGANFPPIYAPGDTVGFVPNSKSQWKDVWVDLSKFVAPNSKFQVIFRNTSNRGNNLYLDNVKISTITLPARLKAKGYMITPNPFAGSFSVQHLLPPPNLVGITVYNSSGQQILVRKYSGNASNNIVFDLSRYSDGSYLIKMVYTDKVITERIIKRN